MVGVAEGAESRSSRSQDEEGFITQMQAEAGQDIMIHCDQGLQHGANPSDVAEASVDVNHDHGSQTVTMLQDSIMQAHKTGTQPQDKKGSMVRFETMKAGADLGRRGPPPVLHRPMGTGRQLPQGTPLDLGRALVEAGPLDHDTQARKPSWQGPRECHAEAGWLCMGRQACRTACGCGLCCCWHRIHVGSSQLQLRTTISRHAACSTCLSVLGWLTTAGARTMARKIVLAGLSEWQIHSSTGTSHTSDQVFGEPR